MWKFGDLEMLKCCRMVEWLNGYIAKLWEGVSNITIQQFSNLSVFQLQTLTHFKHSEL